MELRFHGSWPWRESNPRRQAERRSLGRLKVGRKKFTANLGDKQKSRSAKLCGRGRGLGIFMEGSCPCHLCFPLLCLAFKGNQNIHQKRASSCPRIHVASLCSYQISNNTVASYQFLKNLFWLLMIPFYYFSQLCVLKFHFALQGLPLPELRENQDGLSLRSGTRPAIWGSIDFFLC